MTNITTEDGDKAVFEYFLATTKADVAKDRARILSLIHISRIAEKVAANAEAEQTPQVS